MSSLPAEEPQKPNESEMPPRTPSPIDVDALEMVNEVKKGMETPKRGRKDRKLVI